MKHIDRKTLIKQVWSRNCTGYYVPVSLVTHMPLSATIHFLFSAHDPNFYND